MSEAILRPPCRCRRRASADSRTCVADGLLHIAPPARPDRPRRAPGSPRRCRSARPPERRPHQLPDPLRPLAVGAVVGAHEHRLGAAAQRLGAAHRRADAVLAGLVAGRRDDAAAARVAPTTSGLPRSSGRRCSSTAAKKASRSRWAIMHSSIPTGALLEYRDELVTLRAARALPGTGRLCPCLDARRRQAHPPALARRLPDGGTATRHRPRRQEQRRGLRQHGGRGLRPALLRRPHRAAGAGRADHAPAATSSPARSCTTCARSSTSCRRSTSPTPSWRRCRPASTCWRASSPTPSRCGWRCRTWHWAAPSTTIDPAPRPPRSTCWEASTRPRSPSAWPSWSRPSASSARSGSPTGRRAATPAERTVNPYGLFELNGVWYVVGDDCETEDADPAAKDLSRLAHARRDQVRHPPRARFPDPRRLQRHRLPRPHALAAGARAGGRGRAGRVAPTTPGWSTGCTAARASSRSTRTARPRSPPSTRTWPACRRRCC